MAATMDTSQEHIIDGDGGVRHHAVQCEGASGTTETTTLFNRNTCSSEKKSISNRKMPLICSSKNFRRRAKSPTHAVKKNQYPAGQKIKHEPIAALVKVSRGHMSVKNVIS